jgi:vacuolar-type H+-ATPase subunit E/Vma4
VVEIGLKELEARIREDGEKEIEKIKAETKKEIDEIKRDIQKRADEHVDEIRREGGIEIEMVRRRIISEANTKVKELISLERNNLVDKTFKEAENSILKLEDNEKKNMIEHLAEEGKRSVKDPIILVDSKYKGLLKNAESSNLDDFGVIVMSKDKKLRIDNTLRSRLQQLKIKLKPKVASILFAE